MIPAFSGEEMSIRRRGMALFGPGEFYPQLAKWRAAAKALIEEGKSAGPVPKTFVFVNNRLEGNALATIAAVMEGTRAGALSENKRF